MTGVKHVELFNEKHKFIGDPDGVITQDMIAWVAQGPISDRTSEHLGSSDRGVIMFHKMLVENAARVAKGEEPLGTIRDPAENEPSVDINRGRDGWGSFQVGGGTVFGRQEAPVPTAVPGRDEPALSSRA